MKTGVLLVNLGTPRSTKTSDLRKYLKQFLNDPRVIDIPAVLRFLLVNGIIVPFRAPKVAKEYEHIWTDQGSPLLVYGRASQQKLQERLGPDYVVELGMRYQQPSMESALHKLKDAKVGEIIIISLFPQYASATSGSVAEEAMRVLSKWNVIPDLRFINTFHQHPRFIEAWANNARPHLEARAYDKVLFSYHGVPERHLRNYGKDWNKCTFPECKDYCARGEQENKYCYRSACYETSRLIADQLGIKDYIVTFQSRLGKEPWLQPYTDEMLEHLAETGVKSLLVFSPAFVADCLETTNELGNDYAEDFKEKGGEVFTLVESLNATEGWITLLEDLVLAKKQEQLIIDNEIVDHP